MAVAVATSALTRELRELIAALDRRVPRAGRPGEATIAREAAELREQALQRLRRLDGHRPSGERLLDTELCDVSMTGTPFPVQPGDVVALTVPEFTRDLDLEVEPSIGWVCERFLDDTNRALVWLIRFSALKAWCTRAETNAWLISGDVDHQQACEVAASFALNREWEFDAEDFRSAVRSHTSRR
jgi:hypothetical protein